MANVPRINTTGITGAEGLLQTLFSYIQGLSGISPTPRITSQPLPTYENTGLTRMMQSLKNAPMAAVPGGGIDPMFGSAEGSSATRLAAMPARSAVDQAGIAEQTGIQGQNLQLAGNQLFNNQGLLAMINSLISQNAGASSQIGTFPPSLRGGAQGVAASGTGNGGGGGGLLGIFGL